MSVTPGGVTRCRPRVRSDEDSERNVRGGSKKAAGPKSQCRLTAFYPRPIPAVQEPEASSTAAPGAFFFTDSMPPSIADVDE